MFAFSHCFAYTVTLILNHETMKTVLYSLPDKVNGVTNTTDKYLINTELVKAWTGVPGVSVSTNFTANQISALTYTPLDGSSTLDLTLDVSPVAPYGIYACSLLDLLYANGLRTINGTAIEAGSGAKVPSEELLWAKENSDGIFLYTGRWETSSRFIVDEYFFAAGSTILATITTNVTAGTLVIGSGVSTSPGGFYVSLSGNESISGIKTFLTLLRSDNIQSADATVAVNQGNAGWGLSINGGTMMSASTAGVRGTHVIASGLTAFAGGGQGSATVLTSEYNFISTVASAGDSVLLSPWQFYARMVVVNEGANALNIFPPSGGNLGAGVDTAVSLAAGATAEFVSINSLIVFKQVS